MKNRKKRKNCIQIFVFLNLLDYWIFTFSQKPVGFLKERNQSLERLKRRRKSAMYQNDNGNTMIVELRQTKLTFLKVGAYIFLKRATVDILEGRFC